MKETVQISISGIAFFFDGEAYLELKAYLDRLEKGYRNDPDGAEIVADNVYFGDSKRDGAGDFGGAPASYSAPMGGRNAAPMGGQSDFAEIGEEDGELPF